MSFSVGCVYQLVNEAARTAAERSTNPNTHGSLIGYDPHGAGNQQWLIDNDLDRTGLYRIGNPQGSMTWISYKIIRGPTNQLYCDRYPCPWKIVPDSVYEGCFKFLHPDGELCMDLIHGDPTNGTDIILNKVAREPSQAWRLKLMTQFNPTITPRFHMVNKASCSAADLTSDGSVVGDHVVLHSSRVWITEAVDKSKNLHLIKNTETDAYLSFDGDLSPNKPLIGTPNKQVWEIRLQGSSIPQLVRIYAQGSDYVIAMKGGSSKSGTPVVMCPAEERSLNQQWTIQLNYW
ncbi:hypothetical protein DL93DRAFT_2234320 [Clavulina sp. PMI_390]|nr:hypothetical protein DL93DRAFT_2234320 [Clavulina sp. PMI_390]